MPRPDPRLQYAATPLLELIRRGETGRSDASAYGIVYGGIPKAQRPEGLPSLTVAEVLSWQERVRAAGHRSSAAGAYQIIYKTLRGLTDARHGALALPYSPELQDEFALELIGDGAFLDFLNGKTPASVFALRLARVWASLPVLRDGTAGAHRKLSRGQSYYSGDGLNHAQVPAAELEQVLLTCMRRYQAGAPATAPAQPRATPLAALFAAIVAFFRRPK